MTKHIEINLPISCKQLRYVALIGITLVFVYSMYIVIHGTDNTHVLLLSMFGIVFGGLGSTIGWLIFFIEKKPISIKCRCKDN